MYDEREAPGGLKIITKIGEVSGVRVHKVLGDPHWHSTPTIALEIHNKLKNFTWNSETKPKRRG